MKNNWNKYIIAILLLLCQAAGTFAQAFPSEDENIPFLMTFGKQGSTSWGDDDFSQTFFISIPKDSRLPFYIRIYDPEVGGKHDEMKGSFDTQTKFSVYGGKLAYTPKTAQSPNPDPGYDSGTLLHSKVFGINEAYDGKWYSFGPYNPSEGEWVEKLNSFVFKIICDGISGDDGNLYRYFISTSPNNNEKVEGANGFTYEYTFRLPDNSAICHIYPYVDAQTISVQQYNFDWDSDGIIRIVSVARKGEQAKQSHDDDWTSSKHIIDEREKNTSLDIQFLKTGGAHNNNVVVRVTNQYGEMLPFFSIPIGGRPVYKPQIKVAPVR
jgi:hypothetical protein